MPYVSINIPSYRAASFIGRALESIKSQTFFEQELIVVDGASGDNIEKVITAFAKTVSNRVIFVKQPKNCGPAACRNIGLQQSSGQAVAFFRCGIFLG